ncbi:MAG: ion transporter [Candidatus Pacebacteria bacterium]|nr:ion transporter [Candidatus Paceibacterota bacterium]
MEATSIVRDLFYNPRSKNFLRVNNFFAFLTIVSILFIVLETVVSLMVYERMFQIIEYITVFFFTLEYLGRLFTAPSKIKYMTSFFGIVDLVAIVPTFLGLTNLSFLKAARSVRILRFLRMVRLVKMVRVKSGASNIQHDVDKLTSQIYLFALFSSILLFGTLIYFVEGTNPAFANIPLGMLWAAKLTLGGISQTLPETVWGEIISVGARFVGLLLFGFLIHIVGKFFEKILLGATLEE